MFQPRTCARQIVHSALFLLLWIPTALSDDQGSRLDVLKGNNGETPCSLKSHIYQGCSLSPPSTFNATYESPASCTCNKEFFNIWSACSYSIGENLFPIFSDWMSICSNSGINPEQSQYLSDRNTWGVNAPNWARISVPGNETMDLQNAVLVTVTRPNWSVLQILLPFITALVAVFVTVLVMQLYHNRQQRASWRDKMRRLVRPIPKVKNVEKYEEWEIEANDGGQYELVAPSGASDTYAFGAKSPQQMQAQHQSLHRGGPSSADSEAFEGDDAGWGSLKNMRMPWKKGPNRVQEVLATTEFDIDDHNASSTTVGLANDGESMYSPPEGEVHPADYSDPFVEHR